MSPSKRKGLIHYAKHNVASLTTLLLNTVVLSFLLFAAFVTTRYYYYSSHFKFSNAPIRIFGPSSKTSRIVQQSPKVFHQIFGDADRLWYMQEYGVSRCGLESLQSYKSSSPQWQLEVWKYCVLSMGHGNVYQDDENVAWLTDHDYTIPNLVFKTPKPVTSAIGTTNNRYHGSFLQMIPTTVARQMLQRILGHLEEEGSRSNPHSFVSSTLPQVWNERVSSIREYQVTCQNVLTFEDDTSITTTCPDHSYCCQVRNNDEMVVAALKHPQGRIIASDPAQHNYQQQNKNSNGDNNLNDIIDITTISVQKTGVAPMESWQTPNFFDLLVQNDCVPTTKQCHKCLKSRNSCADCIDDCGCYCQALCQMRPPPKPLTERWFATPPVRTNRLIPRLIHQTWFEPVTPDGYPNMSRLMESWKTIPGWEYTFYDDDTAAHFLQEHFPPAVYDAYDAILPGAFKADLFRYCVLFIKGGIYADMDVLLEASNLDQVLSEDIGFLVPQDEPGSGTGHRSCLWNGLLAVAPGHPILAKTIELVVNHIGHRFTSVDYDDFLCPNPVTSVSHTVDTLFTCGPCILGAAMNAVLGRPYQHEFELGEIQVPSSYNLPGRTIILQQDKSDMGAHRFTSVLTNVIFAVTDMPDYDDRPPTKQHYSRTHQKVGVYGLRHLYKTATRVNERFEITVL